MSFDPPESNASWAETQGFQFELWTDTNHDLAKYYGADGAMAQRVTRVLDGAGTLILEYVVGADIGGHPQQVLEDCDAIFGE